jgi:hypothetical protein
MQNPSAPYKLTIHDVTVDTSRTPAQMNVRYEGHYAPATISQSLDGVGVPDLMKACEAVADRIFHDEFRLNNAVEMTFSLRDERGLSLWHTQPTLYMQCPLTMSMKWSCLHLSNTYKTMTTLGLIELPSTVPLDGNSIDVNRTARVIMDSMANGVEFMGSLMRMRNTLDHDAAKSGAIDPPSGHNQAAR